MFQDFNSYKLYRCKILYRISVIERRAIMLKKTCKLFGLMVIFLALFEVSCFAFEWDFNDYNEQGSPPPGWFFSPANNNYYSRIEPVTIDEIHGTSVKIVSEQGVAGFYTNLEPIPIEGGIYKFSYEFYIPYVSESPQQETNLKQSMWSYVTYDSSSPGLYGIRIDDGNTVYYMAGDHPTSIWTTKSSNVPKIESNKWYKVDAIVDASTGYSLRYYLNGRQICTTTDDYVEVSPLSGFLSSKQLRKIYFGIRTRTAGDNGESIIIDNISLTKLEEPKVFFGDGSTVAVRQTSDNVVYIRFSNSVNEDDIIEKIKVYSYLPNDYFLLNPVEVEDFTVQKVSADGVTLMINNASDGAIYRIVLDGLRDFNGNAFIENEVIVKFSNNPQTVLCLAKVDKENDGTIAPRTKNIDLVFEQLNLSISEMENNISLSGINYTVNPLPDQKTVRLALEHCLSGNTTYTLNVLGQTISFTTGSGALRFNNISFIDSNGEKTSFVNILNSRDFDVDVQIENTLNDDIFAYLIYASYHDQELLDVSVLPITIEALSLNNYRLSVSTSSTNTDYVELFLSKLFLFKGDGSIEPLTKSMIYTKSPSALFKNSADTDGMNVRMNSGAVPNVVTYNGHEGWLVDPEDKYILVDLDDDMIRNITDGRSAVVEVEYYDSGMGTFDIEYDGYKSTHSYTKSVELENNTKKWKKAEFFLPNPMFSNRLDGSDLRISLYNRHSGSSTHPIAFKSIKVRLLDTKSIYKINISTEKQGNIFFTDETAIFHYEVLNHDYPLSQTVNVKYSVLDENGETVWSEFGEIFVPAGQSYQGSVQYKPDKYGLYTFKVEITEEDHKLYSTGEIPFSYARTNFGTIKNNSSAIAGSFYDNQTAYVVNNLGVSFVRQVSAMQYLDAQLELGEDGTYRLKEYYQNRHDLYKGLGLNIMVTQIAGENVGWPNGEKTPKSPESLEMFGEYVTKLVQSYKDVNYYEVWNEWDLVGSQFNRDGLPVENYVNLLKVAYTKTKEANPNAKVIAGSTYYVDYDFIKGMLDNGAIGYFDIISIHPYKNRQSPTESDRYNDVYRIRELLDSYGLQDVKIWVTEIGWSPNYRGEGIITKKQQGDYLVQVCTMFRENNLVDKTFVYCLENPGYQRDNHEHRYGILNYRMHPENPYGATGSYLALSNMNVMLADTVYVGKEVYPDQKVYQYKFYRRSDGKNVYVIWAENENTEFTLHNLCAPQKIEGTNRFVVSGSLGEKYRNKKVTLMLIDSNCNSEFPPPDKIGYIDQSKCDENGTYYFEFTFDSFIYDDNGNIANYDVVINCDGKLLNMDLDQAKFYDIYGNVFEPSYSNGNYHMILGSSPIYIEF